MGRQWNFSAGPAALPEIVLRQAQQELLDWHGTGASVMEISHRGAAFMDMAAEVMRDLRQLLAVPESHHILFLQGGATQHFAQIPLNLAAQADSADYVLSGHWGEKAVREAEPHVGVRIAASSADDGYRRVPDAFDLDPDAAYVHITPNETIHGTEFHHMPETGGVPLVADMSSTLLSRPIDVAQFGLIYAGAQKNIGPSGLVVMIIREDLLQRTPRPLAPILRYAGQAQNDSMRNTPNTWGWYLAGLVFKWIMSQGGLEAMAERNRGKANQLYAAIDESGGFYSNDVASDSRSWMNIPFRLQDAALDARFLEESGQAGLMALKGHRALGGMRASIYNAMPPEGVAVLTDFMRDFAHRHG